MMCRCFSPVAACSNCEYRILRTFSLGLGLKTMGSDLALSTWPRTNVDS